MQHSLWINISLPLPFYCCYRPVRQGERARHSITNKGLSQAFPGVWNTAETGIFRQPPRYSDSPGTGHENYGSMPTTVHPLYAPRTVCADNPKYLYFQRL
jgi:hypothetical protein